MLKGDLLKLISDTAILYRKEGIKKSLQRNKHMNKWSGKEFNQELVDAVLVDFINYVGMCQGVDYAMYTSDLSWENFKPTCRYINEIYCQHFSKTASGDTNKKCQKKGCPCWSEDDRGIGKARFLG